MASILKKLQMIHVRASCALGFFLTTIVSAAVALGAPAAGTPKATGTLLAGANHADGAATIMGLKVDGASVLPDLLFSPDGKFAYALETNGLLRKIQVPNMRRGKPLLTATHLAWPAGPRAFPRAPACGGR